MVLPPQFDQPPGEFAKRIDSAIDVGQNRLFRVLWFILPPQSIARDIRFQALVVSRFLCELSLQALLFSALIFSAQNGGTDGDAAFIGVSFLIPGVLLGLWGGAVADAFPKQAVLVAGYVAMGGLCLLLPLIFGMTSTTLLAALFTVRILHQVTQPAEASAAPLVADSEELASANSFLHLSSSAGEVLGKALLAPIMVSIWGITPVGVLAGVLFVLSGIRVAKFKPTQPLSAPGTTTTPKDRFSRTSLQISENEKPRLRHVLVWLLSEKETFIMLLLAAMASTIGVVLTVLAPRYVLAILNISPQYAFYVFAPAAVGFGFGMLAVPFLINNTSEKIAGFIGFVLVAVSVSLIGQIEPVSQFLRPLLLLDLANINDLTQAAGMLSFFTGLGITLAAAATQTYIGKYVPYTIHGRVFALLGVLKDGLAIPQLVAIGVITDLIGVATVLTVAPFGIIFIAGGLLLLSSRYGRESPRAEQ